MIFIVVPLFVSLSIAATLESPFFKLMCTELGKLSYPIYCFHYPIFSIYSTFHKNKNLDLIEISILIFATAFLAKAVVIYLDEPISFWFKSKGYR
jgi:peptidoglycan/LPS O-acetylase OafA/YrhL